MTANSVLRELAPGLDFCPATNRISGARTMDILATSRAQQFFQLAGEAYDMVIVDTPSMDEFVDTRTIVKHCDRIVFVVEADRTSGAKADEMLEMISDARNRVEILVMNRFRETPFAKMT